MYNFQGASNNVVIIVTSDLVFNMEIVAPNGVLKKTQTLKGTIPLIDSMQ